MPDNPAGLDTSWTQESVEKQAVELEKTQKTDESATSQADPEVQKTTEDPPKKDHQDNLIGAVTELRAQRREALARAAAMEQNNAQLTQQMQQLMAHMQQSRQPQIDPNDPVAVLQATAMQTNQQLQNLTQEQQRQAWNAQQQLQEQRFVTHVQGLEAQFAKEKPDVAEAVNFLKTSRVAEYKAGGLSHQEAVQRMLYDERELVNWALQNGENPAKAAYDMAAQRGYTTSKQKLEMQQKGQQASTPTGGGGKSGGEPSLEALLKMSHSDFAEATKGDKWQKLLSKYQ